MKNPRVGRVVIVAILFAQIMSALMLVGGWDTGWGLVIDAATLLVNVWTLSVLVPAYVGVRDGPGRVTVWRGPVPWPVMPRVSRATVTRTYDPEDGSVTWVIEEGDGPEEES